MLSKAPVAARQRGLCVFMGVGGNARRQGVVVRFASRCTVSAPGRARETLRRQIKGDMTFPAIVRSARNYEGSRTG